MTLTKRLAVALGLGTIFDRHAVAAPANRHDSTYSYSIAIENGNVRYLLQPGDSPTTVSGRIGSDGAVDLDIRRSIAKVDANGRLTGKAGAGTWQLGMLGCSGRWTAQKRSSDV
ncbi:hypothetical protein [Microvirga sp. CF3016]|uniref:hypothetical protein n=1 Tax=Microvirga sp. CF3016 TaxID=3110181 RepID=UPI002E76183F|nr:hypothetical protein [Microvirga sp. CF3016]MEE1610105.1 hypothetical protein [Microvirga sp. CF3016]